MASRRGTRPWIDLRLNRPQRAAAHFAVALGMTRSRPGRRLLKARMTLSQFRDFESSQSWNAGSLYVSVQTSWLWSGQNFQVTSMPASPFT
jgi:hypothetical protein